MTAAKSPPDPTPSAGVAVPEAPPRSDPPSDPAGARAQVGEILAVVDDLDLQIATREEMEEALVARLERLAGHPIGWDE